MTSAVSLIDRLCAALPPLDVRLRRPEIEAIAARVGSEDRLLDAALEWLEEGVPEIAALERALEDLEQAPSPDRVTSWLGPAATRGERRAARAGRLGVEVVRERTAEAIASIGIRDELLLKLVEGRLPTGRPPPPVVVAALTEARRWPVRRAAARALEAFARGGGLGGSWLRAVEDRATQPQEHPWVRDACDGALLAAAPDRGGEVIRRGLADRRGSDAFLLRRLRAERVVATWPEHIADWLGPVARHDPSEHVRIGLAAALSRSPAPGASALLLELAESPDWRVRLAAAEYTSRAGAQGPPDRLFGVLAARLPAEDVPAVRAALGRAAEKAAAILPGQLGALRALLDLALTSGASPEGDEPLAAARRVCLRSGDPAAIDLVTRIRAQAGAIRPGHRAWVSWSTLGVEGRPPDDTLGHALAEVAREDYGLWADPADGGTWIGRGDPMGFRVWRFLHEIRHPAPNKRQNFDHTVGRRKRGTLRAPSTRMAQVTATTVPGEPTLVDREGSWVPALPTVDDALDVGAGTAIYTSWGVTRVAPARSRLARFRASARAAWEYASLARLRTASLAADDPGERGAYVRALRDRLGVQVDLTLDDPAPERIRALGTSHAVGIFGWIAQQADAILAPGRTSQPALALFAGALVAGMLARGFLVREGIRAARASLPLVIGGWGTRGKSGTERIKAGLFHGLGHPVFVKTTGCEAMFIAARPGLPGREVFLFRPHDKATIWEQASVLEQAASMGARVMLWECMALRPRFVELLEQQWMADDMVTLTNAFPDHEDVQGPAGHDIATVISSFVPRRSVAITSEVEFLPVFRERARERGSELDAVDPVEADLLGEDLLARFPYQEHPRNIALVARLAERLGIERDLAIATMADHVVPDLGVLRVYPTVRIRGRDVRFINGMSANERTGCVANWRRTGCDQISIDAEPDHAIVVVVNNRADRVARSEVFARILVQDLSADVFVLIGTNLTGLRGYVERALDAELAQLQLRPAGFGPAQVEERLRAWMRRLRIGAPSAEAMVARARAGAWACGRAFTATGELHRRLRAWLSPDGARGLELDGVVADLDADLALREAFAASIEGEAHPDDAIEVLAPPSPDEVWAPWRDALARQVLHARLLQAARAERLDDDAFRSVYRDLFLRSLHAVADPKASGDAIVARVAGVVQPGLRVTCMGVQNIKGTGLDFAYRWVALGLVARLLERARAVRPDGRAEALRALLAFDDPGLVDSGLVRGTLSAPAAGEDADEAALRERVVRRAAEIHDARISALGVRQERRWWTSLIDAIEAVLDPVDAVWRAFTAERTMRRLQRRTISLAEAARQMQALYDRQKGGWLAAWFDR